ncbi:MAG: hypothetical protein WKF81_12700 [Thermomicrobiales bacterium]
MSDLQIAVTHILVHTRRNVVVLLPAAEEIQPTTPELAESGVLDIGIKGHLIGFELGNTYYSVWNDDVANDHLIRSVDVDAGVVRLVNGSVHSIEIPRRGERYELSYPIGNQCWRQVIDGVAVESCVTTVSN